MPQASDFLEPTNRIELLTPSFFDTPVSRAAYLENRLYLKPSLASEASLVSRSGVFAMNERHGLGRATGY